jgi:hypothetical protein
MWQTSYFWEEPNVHLIQDTVITRSYYIYLQKFVREQYSIVTNKMKNTFASNGNRQSSMGIPNGGRAVRGGKGERQISRDHHGDDQGNQCDLLDTEDNVMDDDCVTTTTNKFYNGETPWEAPPPNTDDSIFHTTATTAAAP